MFFYESGKKCGILITQNGLEVLIIMCTAVAYKTKDFYFGRNFDLERSYNETVTITPRNYPLKFRKEETLSRHFAIIGMAAVSDDYPLYYDAVNEKGLCMAGLNFPENAVYKPPCEDKSNITPFELTLWILGQCSSVEAAEGLLRCINPVDIHFSRDLPLSPLHWMISDRNKSITVEPLADGLKISENPVCVLTNNPPFAMQMFHLTNYMALSKKPPKNSFSDELQLKAYSRGMGGIGMPGDLSSASRFVKAAFTRLNSVSGDSEEESVSQFFHILGSVEQQRGCVELSDGVYELTLYSSCCNADRGIYYYTTYDNRQINAVNMNRENLDGCELICYPLITRQQIKMIN